MTAVGSGNQPTWQSRWGLGDYRAGPPTRLDRTAWLSLWPRGTWAEWQITGAGKALVLASSPDTGRVWLVKATPYDPVGLAETTVYFSTGRPDMAAPVYDGVLWPARLTTPVNTAVEVFTGEFGGAIPTFGVVQIALVAGEYDSLLDYYWDGRDIFIYRGPQDAGGVSDMSLVFKGTVRSAQWDRYMVTLNLADYGEVVQKPIQTTLYAGTGGAEGGDDLKGKPKPLCFGKPRNVEPTLLSSAYLVYQVHSRSIAAVDAVYDRAAVLTAGSDYASYTTLTAAVVTAGTYATCIAEGLIRLGGTPVGPVTADIQGDNTGGLAQTAADIVARIADDFTDLDSSDRDWSAFAALNRANSAPCSLYVGSAESPSAADLFTALMVSVGGFWTFTSERKLTVRQVAISTAKVAISYDYGPLALDGVGRAETLPPYWRSKMGYARAWRVHGENEVAASADVGSIGIDINYEDFATTSNGKAFIRGLDLEGGRADVDGWYYHAGQMVTLPRAQFADGSTLKTSQESAGYIVHDFDAVTPSFIELFPDAALTEVTSRAPYLGTSWTEQIAAAQNLSTNGSGKGYFRASGAPSTGRLIYTAASAPSSADCFVEFQIDDFPSANSDALCLFARYASTSSMYLLSIGRNGTAEPQFTLQVDRVTGSGSGSSVIGLIYPAYVPGVKFRLTCIGSAISVWVKYPGDGQWTLLATGTDANISAAGNCGIATGSVAYSVYQSTNARFSNYRDGNIKGAWTVSTEPVAVVFARFDGTNWEYDTGSGWTDFTRTDSMLVIGPLDRGASSITSASLTQPQVIPPTDAQTTIVRGAFVRQLQRLVTSSDTAVQTRHKLAREREVSSLLDAAADATTENARQHALLDAKWDIYRVPVQRKAIDDFQLTLGDTVTLKLNRFGLTAGRDMLIGGMATGGDPDETILTLWG